MMRLFLAFFISLLLFQITNTRASKTAPLYAANLNSSSVETIQQATGLDEASQLNQKAVQLFNEGKLDEAHALAKRVLEIREKALGKDHQLVIEALLNLAGIKLSKGFYRESLSLYERILKNNEKLAGPDDASNIVLLDKIAYLRYMIGDFVGAEKFYKRSLSINEKAAAPDSEQVAQAAYNLAEFYRFTDKYEQAEPYYTRVLNIRDKTLAANDPKLIRTIDRYRCIFFLSERKDKLEAFDRERRALYDLSNADASLDVINGKAISLPKPKYPTEARLARVKGLIVIKVSIDETGRVIKAESICGGNFYLVKAATDAAYEARFSPTTVSGTPVKVAGLITYRFYL